MPDTPNQDTLGNREVATPVLSFTGRLRDKIIDHLAATLVITAFGFVLLLATLFKDYLLGRTKDALGMPELEGRLATAEKSLEEMNQATSTHNELDERLTTVAKSLQEKDHTMETAHNELEERLTAGEQRLQEQIGQTASEYTELAQRLATIESHLHNVAQTASATVDTVYVFKHEFVFPHPMESLSVQTRTALGRCAFDDVEVPEDGPFAEYFEQLMLAATMNESFPFRADVGTRAELQYDVRCYTSERANYQYPNPLDLEVHVNGNLLAHHEGDWSRRKRDTMRPLDSMTESAGTDSSRVHQLSVYLAHSKRCPSHFPKVISGQLSQCTFDGLIHVSDSMPTLQPPGVFPSLDRRL